MNLALVCGPVLKCFPSFLTSWVRDSREDNQASSLTSIYNPAAHYYFSLFSEQVCPLLDKYTDGKALEKPLWNVTSLRFAVLLNLVGRILRRFQTCLEGIGGEQLTERHTTSIICKCYRKKKKTNQTKPTKCSKTNLFIYSQN